MTYIIIYSRLCGNDINFLFNQELSEGGQAKDTFGGKLTQDFVAERLNHSNFNDVKELDFPQCNVRSIDLGNGDSFLNLRRCHLNNVTQLFLEKKLLCFNPKIVI